MCMKLVTFKKLPFPNLTIKHCKINPLEVFSHFEQLALIIRPGNDKLSLTKVFCVCDCGSSVALRLHMSCGQVSACR